MSDFVAGYDRHVLTLGDRLVGHGKPTLFVAEEGQANAGDPMIALRMIQIAADAGADAIEFQLAIADDLYVRSHEGHAIYQGREFDQSELALLVTTASKLGIGFVATALSPKLVPTLSELGCTLFNLNSSDLDNPEMIDSVTDTGKPFLISTAMALSLIHI